MSALRAQNIVKRYAGHTALDDVSIDVPEGAVYGLLGPNGAGKTSLIRIINQITAPDSGEVFLAGRPLSREHVEKIGYLPEERGLYRKMKVGEQALYLAQLKGLSKRDALKKLKYWFEKLEIQTWWDKKVEELSKGMQQKVQFITTVLHEPSLLILDEPFSGFDPINSNLLKKEILELRDKGATIIFSTHNMSSVEEICTHIALINRSKKILEGTVGDIKSAYKNSTYEVSYKGTKVAFANALWTQGEIIASSEESGFNYVQVKLTSGATTNSLLQAIIPAVEVHGLREIIPSMNDIFIEQVMSIDPNAILTHQTGGDE